MDITVTVTNQDFIDILKDIATKNSTTIEAYINGVVESWLQNHLRQAYISYLRNVSFDVLKTKIGTYSDIS